ncbi:MULTISPECIES: hypothetical protein [Haloarcula]|uniref:DUF7965 domain-containing protein n=1 Tax=Haloarcula pellucida TaxID=1427151 RepID=A0A830GRR7_9EURY|nr:MULTISPECIES: hypothetical protein [Halomicroarcula]MBX0350272.1 hypothetical protein [Halomicroarcula pellucida]MDS0277626.1 hypothetical protein [Halomicroarcula sp. S1AR25-4]GGO01272.1 hypothetical protein GCM10009030_34740 [Halomicroarcula pellucida]
MAEADPGDPALSLTTWALATFDVALFVLAALLPIHAAGALADLLSGLNTLLGVAVFCYLWALFVLAVRWVLSDAVLSDPLRSLVPRGVAAGSAAGVVFLLGVLLVAAGPGVVAGRIEPLSAFLIALIGGAVAAVVGSLVGLLLGAVDVALYKISSAALPDPPTRREDSASATPDRP